MGNGRKVEDQLSLFELGPVIQPSPSDTRRPTVAEDITDPDDGVAALMDPAEAPPPEVTAPAMATPVDPAEAPPVAENSPESDRSADLSPLPQPSSETRPAIPTITHASLMEFFEYLERAGLCVAGEMEFRPDPDDPTRLTAWVPVAPIKKTQDE